MANLLRQAKIVHKMVRPPLISGNPPLFRGYYKKMLQTETHKLIRVARAVRELDANILAQAAKMKLDVAAIRLQSFAAAETRISHLKAALRGLVQMAPCDSI